MVPAGSDGFRQWQRDQLRSSYRRLAHKHRLNAKERDNQGGKLARQRLTRLTVSITGVKMGERHMSGETATCCRQRLAHVPQQQKLGCRNTIRMGRYGPLAYINVAIGQEFAKMIVGSPVAEPKLKHLAVQVSNQTGGQIETSALGFEPPNKAVQPTHEQSSGNAGGLT